MKSSVRTIQKKNIALFHKYDGLFLVLLHLVNFKTLPAHIKASVILTTIIYTKKRNVPISFHFFHIFLLESTSLFLSEAFE